MALWVHTSLAPQAGSSRGEAAALASGMSAIGLGNDISGSLRNPSNRWSRTRCRLYGGRRPSAGGYFRKPMIESAKLGT
jgi:Asp-tRNA(Asn)/Glu-tRNA(Gln) amidotransferase A subunit family amidase